ncbi:ATP-grasp domain-containing protein [Caulobacter henricii]|uniref:ATP-grasp domain-containing protein n=1 Tax=Caulobacter henricii TaxID=69395 RepID=UPI0014131AC8|nr:hypothetical protein [Caulobacter henricii]
MTGNNDGHTMLSMLCPSIELGRIHVAPSYFRQSKRWNPNAADLLWNIISDVDQNPDTLDIARKLVSTASRPIVNPPSLMGRTRRHTLAGLLQGLDGVIVPKVLLLRNPTLERVSKAAAEAGFRFPAILRQTGSHNGEMLGVFNAPEDMAQIFGDRKNAYYLTEFVDVRRADRFYRKSRFFFVGDTIITRQHVIADKWYVHGGAGVLAEHAALRDEARAMLIDGFEALPLATRTAVDAIRQAIGFDYCGLDCCIQEDGRVVVFEANATMNFSPRFDNQTTQHNRAALPRMLAALRRLIEAKTGRTLAENPAKGLEG